MWPGPSAGWSLTQSTKRPVVVTDFMDAERRLQRNTDKPGLEVLRVVQQTHAEMLSKLTDTSNVLATTQAVQANTMSTIADTQREHARTLTEHEKAIAANALRTATEHAESRGWRKAIVFGIPVILTVVISIVGAAAYVLERIPKL